MRSFFELVTQGLSIVKTMELAARVEPGDLAALRSAGVLRPHSPPGAPKKDATEEISIADLVRALRASYGVDPRGLPTPHALDRNPGPFGWRGAGPEQREVVLVGRSRADVASVLHRDRRTLALIVDGRWLTDAERAKHGPTAFVAVEALDERWVARDGALVLARAGEAPSALVEPSAEPLAAKPARVARPVVPGAARWNEVTIHRLDEQTVRVDLGGRSHRRTHVDLGMAHGQSRAPTLVWAMLMAFCEGNGSLETSRFGGVLATKKLVSRMRESLRVAFGLEDDPLHPYVRKQGWRTRFVASPATPHKERG